MALVLSKSNEWAAPTNPRKVNWSMADVISCSGGMDDADIRRYFDAHKNRLPAIS